MNHKHQLVPSPPDRHPPGLTVPLAAHETASLAKVTRTVLGVRVSGARFAGRATVNSQVRGASARNAAG